jgi:phospholipase C
LPASVHGQRRRWEDELSALDSAAAGPAMTMPDEEAGAVAAHRHLARSARNALATHGNKAPQSISRRRRKDHPDSHAWLMDAGEGLRDS